MFFKIHALIFNCLANAGQTDKLPGEQKQKMVVQTISCVIHFEQFPLLCHLHKVKKEDSLAIFLEENYSFTLNLLYFSDLVKNQQNIILIQQDALKANN